MSSKTARDPAKSPGRHLSGTPWSLAVRLAAGYCGAAFVLLLVTTTFAYWALARNLEREDDEYVAGLIAEIEMLLRTDAGNVSALKAELDRESAAQFSERLYVRVLDSHQRVLAETAGISEELRPEFFPPPVPFRSRRAQSVDVASPLGRPVHVLSTTITSGQAEFVVQLAVDHTVEARLLSEFRRQLMTVFLVGLVACATASYWIARRGLRPLEQMAGVMKSVGSSTLHQRLEGSLPAELSSLAATFNAMLRRLEDAFTRLSRFSADIAHELRTPVHNVRGMVEVTLAQPGPSEEGRRLLVPCLEECQRLSRLIDNLLFVARAQNPRTQINRDRVVVGVELAKVQEFYEAAAAEAGVALDLDVAGENGADLDRTLLQRALCNLVENALAHTPHGGTIRLSDRRQGDAVRIVVSDTGCGIPADHLPRLFDRFHRVDPSRSKNTGGVGLGLAIVKSIARLHGGSVEVDSQLGVGTRFSLILPVDATSPEE